MGISTAIPPGLYPIFLMKSASASAFRFASQAIRATSLAIDLSSSSVMTNGSADSSETDILAVDRAAVRGAGLKFPWTDGLVCVPTYPDHDGCRINIEDFSLLSLVENMFSG